MNTISHLEATELGCIRQGKWIFPAVSFSLRAGQTLLIEGNNGAGKSSLLRLLAGVASPAAGKILQDTASIHDRLGEYTEHLHYIGHSNGIRLGLTVAENLQLAGELAQQPIQDIQHILSLLQLDKMRETQAQFLSAGQKRRVALAKLFLIPRQLWILDEPLTALDVATQNILLKKIEEHNESGGMCIMTSHQPVHFMQQIQTLRIASC